MSNYNNNNNNNTPDYYPVMIQIIIIIIIIIGQLHIWKDTHLWCLFLFLQFYHFNYYFLNLYDYS